MVRRKVTVAALILSLICSACAITEMTMAHENPLDTIFDSGAFRLVLTGQATSSTSSTLSWAPVFYKADNGSVTELSASDITTGATQMLYKSTLPTQTDINNVKGGAALTGFTVIPCTIKLGTAGNCAATTAPYKGYYIIDANYTYESKSGKIYSNFAVVQ